MSRREALGCPAALGHFVNLVPIRNRVARDLPFTPYLTATVEKFRTALGHADLPCEDAVASTTEGRRSTAAARVVLAQEVRSQALPQAGPILSRWPRPVILWTAPTRVAGALRPAVRSVVVEWSGRRCGRGR
ncbi:hypothetical protein [Kitasatospora kifunensis]|uniref:Condensation domain-containing protein n=1 Tax=Kitasatospora kifunensis TaxID=58351 RepID=A0A7W7VZ15_KITKI|nr:hypothetical protein [Kitasatospora kifunensis]MBB4928327.1 hypothetical protein [Kitasatospora kifunensis]